ncbi:hypothetical protein [Streptomyces sp. NPDC004680]
MDERGTRPRWPLGIHIYGDINTYLHKGLMLDDATIDALRAKLLA